uniref:Uncharacterized protein n=1 Tax=viral metagenome TaxID=1070528 RepID=A0A6M3LFP8_9ZZZZ
MIINNIGVELIGNQAFRLTGSITQNNIPVLEDNYVRKMNANRGFSEQRMFRKIASIPDVAHLNAIQEGYNLDDPKDLRRFLRDNPEYMTVERIDSHRSPNIIIK